MKIKKWIAVIFFAVCSIVGCQYKTPEQPAAGKVTEYNGALPASYDGRKKGRVPAVKNQGNLGTCWAFASLQALEASLLPGESKDFSEDHMFPREWFFHPSGRGR